MKKRRNVIRSLCLSLFISTAAVMPVRAESVEEAQKKVDELKNEKDNAQAEKDSVELQLQEIAAEMESTQKKLDAKQEEIVAAEEALVQARVEENTQYQSMKKRIKFMYEQGSVEFIEVLAKSKDISDFLNKTEYISEISEYDREKLKDFQEIVRQVEEQEQTLEKEYQELDNLQTELINKQNEVKQLLEEKKVKLSQLEGELGEKMKNLQKLVEEEKRRQEEAAAAAAAAEAARKAAEEAARKAQEDASRNNSYQTSVSTPSSGSNTVVSGNGYFTHPCPGMQYQSSYFGEIREFEVGGHKGHDYAAAVGTPTYAAAAGRVIIAGYSSSAGNWVVIDHGNGLTTKYMHHSALYVVAGQYVEKGQQIGAVGSTGQSTGPHLHFQVEEYGVAVSPDKYL